MKTRSLAFLGLACAAFVSGGFAQSAPAPKVEFPSASPSATLKQRVGVTDIEINYSRPSARGRKVFGGLVPYGEVWRTGANQATRISFSTPLKFGGTDVSAGTYEVFTIPGVDEWTVILSQPPKAQWGAYSYDSAHDVARVKAKPAAVPNPIETFTIQVSSITGRSAALYFAWENTRVSVPLEFDVVGLIKPQVEALMASNDEKKPYANAAMFYLDYGLDLNQAAEWMDAAIAQQPDAFYLVYRKALIQEKQGKKAEALATAEKSLADARKASGSLKDEYVRLNEALIARLR